MGVRWGGVWQEIEGGTPYAAKPSIAAHDPDTGPKSNARHEFLEIFICLWEIVIDTSWGLSAHSGGGGTVGSGDWAFYIVTLAALDLDTDLDECSSQWSDWHSIDMARGKTQKGAELASQTARWKLMVGELVGIKQKRPERGVFIRLLAERAGFEPAEGY